jgi:hypothetical protein
MGMKKHLALAAACCGTFCMIAGGVIAGSGVQAAGAATTVQAVPAMSAGRGIPAAISPRQLAEDNAASILAAFRRPPGAVRSGRINLSWLNLPLPRPAGTDLVTKTAWWRAPGKPQVVLAWIQRHLPSRFSLMSSGAIGQAAVVHVWFDQFTLPPVPGVLPTRWLLVSVTSDGAGHTAIRAAAQVVWMPPKPAAERIPAAARIVTITPVAGVNPLPSGDRPVTVADAAKATSIAKAVDTLPLFPPGVFHCPADFGRGIELTFRAAPSGPPLAVVTADTSGCGTVTITVNGQPEPDLWHGATLEQQVFKVAGIKWAGFPGPA